MFGSKVDSFTNPPLIENFDINFLRGIKTWIVGTFFAVYTAFANMPSQEQNPDSLPAKFGNAFKEAIFGNNDGDSSSKPKMPKTSGANTSNPGMSNMLSHLNSANPTTSNPKGAKKSKISSDGLRGIQERRQREHAKEMLQKPQAQQQPWAGKLM